MLEGDIGWSLSVVARSSSFLVQEVDDLDHSFLASALELWDESNGLLVLTWHKVPHEDVLLLGDLSVDLLVVSVKSIEKSGQDGEF